MLALILFALSIVTVSYLPFVLATKWVLLVIAVFTLVSIKTKRFYLLSIPLGFVYASMSAHHLMATALPDELDRVGAIVVGQVVGLPTQKGSGIRFEFIVKKAIDADVENPKNLSHLINQRISISYNQQYNRDHPLALESFTPGNYLRLHLKVRKPRGFVNPVGFDYQLYLLRKKITATAYIKSDSINTVLPDVKNYSAGIYRDLLRLQLREFAVQNAANDNNTAGPLLALMTGDKQLMSVEQWDLFKDTGTIHLMVISGLHIGLVAFFGFSIGRLIVKFLQLILANNNIARSFLIPVVSTTLSDLFPSFLSILLSGIYAAMSGFGLPTQRALIMVCVFHIAYCRRADNHTWFAFFIAMAFVLLLDPLAAHTPGFWLSFGAVGILLFSFAGFDSNTKQNVVKRSLLQWLKSQWVLLVGLGVPSVVLLGGVSVSSFISNFIAIPIVSFIIVPIVLLSGIFVFIFEPAAIVIFYWAQMGFSLLLECLNWINNLFPHFYVYPNSLSAIVIVLGVVGACYFLAPGIAYRYIALVCFLPILFYVSPAPQLRLTFLDVGQGTAIVIETKNHQMVYDMGKRYSDQFDSGADIVAPYLLSLGYKNIDMFMVSHGDNDHAGGLNGLSEFISAKKRLVGEVSKTSGEQCIEGQKWQWDEVSFEVLWPSEAFIKTQPVYYKSNNTSCVLLIKAGQQSALLAGDIDRSVERRIVKRLSDERSINVVLAPHHGSKTSSSQSWVDSLTPQYVVFTAGFRNAYGHPHSSVVERYKQAGVQILNTSMDGAIRLEIDQYRQDWALERWRYDYPRLWYSQ